jgi:hypothetical protein
VAAPLALAPGAAYWGAAVTSAVPAGGSSPAGAGILLVVIAVAAWFARRVLERGAGAADVTLAQADRAARAQHVALARGRERREHERLLHDTVLNTLTALARPGLSDRGDRDEVAGRCRRDVELMEYALSDPGGPAEAAGGPYGGLLIGITAAAIEMRARGLDVHVNVAGEPEGRTGRPAGERGGARLADRPAAAGPPELAEAPVVPVPVAVAMSYAVREALANVVSHAGTAEAWVEVSLAPAGDQTGRAGPLRAGAPAAPGEAAADAGGQADHGEAGARPSLEVTVRDAGAGFDPARVDPVRLGLRRSIVERIAEWGGRASVRSAPGEGTVVSLRWTASAQPPGQAAADGPGVRW